MTRWLKALTWALLLLPPLAARAVEVTFRPVADGVYAFVGEKGARSAQNEGLNANLGLVITPAGAVLIDSGATFQSARQIHDAVKAVTPQAVKSFNAAPFARLLNAAELMPGNASRTYLEIERE